MKKRHRLKVVGITYSQIESGVYALILEEVNGDRRIPIVIGYPEAQAIECKLQEVNPPRPLTHDLMRMMMERFGLRLSCVDIRKLDSGVFAADLLIEGPDGELMKIDARSSDAIALALRTGAPIYTSTEVLETSSFSRDIPSGNPAERKAPQAPNIEGIKIDILEKGGPKAHADSIESLIAGIDDETAADADGDVMEFLNNYSDKEIERQIAKFAEEEKYELAARLKKLFAKRRGGI